MIIHELQLRGVLSFGPDAAPLPMRPLNVLIGPNGSGKSNIIEALNLLRSAAGKLTAPMHGQGGGGVAEWIWKGRPSGPAIVEAVVDNPRDSRPLRHRIAFAESGARFELVDERIEDASTVTGESEPTSYYRFQDGRPALRVRDGSQRQLQRQDVLPDESILSQRRDPDQYPELAHLEKVYGSFRIYREWSFGRSSIFRAPQPADMPSDRLAEDFSNLGLFLNRLRGIPQVKRTMLARLRDLFADVDDFDIRVRGGTVEVFLTEGDFVIPASRLSDGTLRYLCLLAILCDPEPPALICIEEPELGLHPDILPKIADLLLEASTRTQLVVTTHSDILVDAMTEHPEAVVVMEKHDASSTARRLDVGELGAWLEKYRLGQLWTRGQIGGTRW